MDTVESTPDPGPGPHGIPMPQLDPHILKVTVTQWLKKVGDSILQGEPVCQVSSQTTEGGMAVGLSDEIATAEVASPVSGTLTSIFVPAGSKVPVKTILAEVFGAPVPSQTPPSPDDRKESERQTFPYLSSRAKILDVLRRSTHAHDDCVVSRLFPRAAEMLFDHPKTASWSTALGRPGFLISPHDLGQGLLKDRELAIWIKRSVAKDWHCSLIATVVENFDPWRSCGLGFGRPHEMTVLTDESYARELSRLIDALLAHEARNAP